MKLRGVALVLALVVVRLASAGEPTRSPLVVISLDGFRWDYADQFAEQSPTLNALRREGASGPLIPVFPSNTFPNHYTLVTGLTPSHHGIVNNDFFDADSGRVFRYTNPAASTDPRWWGGEPIWITAVKQGRASAVSFWAGSEAEIHGTRATYWEKFDPRAGFEQRLDQLVAWFRRPPAERPAVALLYLEETNAAGHRFGPDAPETAAAVKVVDTYIATVLARLRAENLEPNLLVLSDHGMTPTALERVILLDDIVPRDSVQIDAEGSVVMLRPLKGDAATLVAAFAGVPHVKASRVEDLPARFRLTPNARLSPVWVLPDEGWELITRPTFERLKVRYAATTFLRGDHGYDPALPSMHGFLLAHGPAFRRGETLAPVESFQLYSLMCRVLGLQPAPNDGDDRLARAALRP